jgi:hypothetical protein
VAIVKREPAGAPGNEWCEFEERPAPLDAQEDDCITIYIIYQEREIPQWPKSAELRCENEAMRQRLMALEKWLPDETKQHKALLPEWLVEDLRQQGIRFDASGRPEKSSLEEKALERIVPATPAPSQASPRSFYG